MNQYETVFILTPVLSAEQVKEAADEVKKSVADNGGEIVSVEDWGLRKLAYPIQKKESGFYVLVEYKAEPTFIQKLETEFKRDEKFIRFSTVKMDKDAIAYSIKRRDKLAQNKEA